MTRATHARFAAENGGGTEPAAERLTAAPSAPAGPPGLEKGLLDRG